MKFRAQKAQIYIVELREFERFIKKAYKRVLRFSDDPYLGSLPCILYNVQSNVNGKKERDIIWRWLGDGLINPDLIQCLFNDICEKKVIPEGQYLIRSSY